MKRNQPVKVFISHSDTTQDKEWLGKLENTYLANLESQKIISIWHSRKIGLGKERQQEIDAQIKECTIILLLVSPDFLGSEAYTHETELALKRREEDDEVYVIPIILRPCEWQESLFAKLQPLPRSGIAISKLSDEDEAFEDITKNLRSIIKELETPGQEIHDVGAETAISNFINFKKKEFYRSIGVDIGTTKIAAGLVEIFKDKGTKYNSENFVRWDHDQDKRLETILKKIIEIIDEVIEKAGIEREKIDGIGLGLPGQVRRTDGFLTFAPGLQIENVNFCAKLQQHYSVPVHADNDVNCATFAELAVGCGERFKDFVCIFFGTGIGAGIVINKRMVRGHHYAAGEIGHMKIDTRFDARECTCGQRGCYEEYASARAIIRLARIKIFDVIERQGNSLLRTVDPRKIGTRDIVALVKEGDDEARALMREIARNISIGLANIANLLNPKAIILGGGVIDGFYAFPEFEKTIRKKFKDYAIPACATVTFEKTSFESTDYGNPAPIIGAALLPFEIQ